MEDAAQFVALDNRKHYTDELFYGVTSKRMYQGRVQIILQSTKTTGNVALKIISTNLKKKFSLKTCL